MIVVGYPYMKKSAFFTIIGSLIIGLIVIILIMVMQPVRISIQIAAKAPLSALATITSREPTQVAIRIAGKNNDTIEVVFARYAAYHEIPILGLYADSDNQIDFVLKTESGKEFERSHTIRTKKLPSDYPVINVERFLPEKIAPGMTFLQMGHYDEDGNFSSMPVAVDSYGEIRWYYTEKNGHILKQLDSGNFLIQGGRAPNKQDNLLLEIDLLGRIVATRAEVPTGIHHDVTILSNGNLLLLSSAPNSFEDGVIEVDGISGQLLRGWDFRAILDARRPPQPKNLEPADWLHLNGIDCSPLDSSFVISGRDQSSVVKVDVDTGTLRWILGNHAYWDKPHANYLLTPIGDDFTWQWGQHAPMVHPDNPDIILLYDNGNERSYDKPVPPEQNFSRAVEYRIDPVRMEVQQIWQYGEELGSETFTPFIGDANYLSNGNRLICFGGITRDLAGRPVEIFNFAENRLNVMKISARIVEVTEDQPAQEVMRITIQDENNDTYEGYRSYQAERYVLYHPALLAE